MRLERTIFKYFKVNKMERRKENSSLPSLHVVDLTYMIILKSYPALRMPKRQWSQLQSFPSWCVGPWFLLEDKKNPSARLWFVVKIWWDCWVRPGIYTIKDRWREGTGAVIYPPHTAQVLCLHAGGECDTWLIRWRSENVPGWFIGLRLHLCFNVVFLRFGL